MSGNHKRAEQLAEIIVCVHNIIAADAYILRAELRCINQPVAQTSVKALATEDIGLLGAGAPDMGIESTLASFMRQAEIFRSDGCILT